MLKLELINDEQEKYIIKKPLEQIKPLVELTKNKCIFFINASDIREREDLACSRLDPYFIKLIQLLHSHNVSDITVIVSSPIATRIRDDFFQDIKPYCNHFLLFDESANFRYVENDCSSSGFEEFKNTFGQHVAEYNKIVRDKNIIQDELNKFYSKELVPMQEEFNSKTKSLNSFKIQDLYRIFIDIFEGHDNNLFPKEVDKQIHPKDKSLAIQLVQYFTEKNQKINQLFKEKFDVVLSDAKAKAATFYLPLLLIKPRSSAVFIVQVIKKIYNLLRAIKKQVAFYIHFV